MKINWVLSNEVVVDPTIDLNDLKNIGPFWGGWHTWRSYSTDNVVCHTVDQAMKLVNSNFHTRCNLYLPAAGYQELGRPSGVKLYHGEFAQLVDNPDDIVSMHLASTAGDIVLLLGFNLTDTPLTDKLQLHKRNNYNNYFRQIISNSCNVQWVLLDQDNDVNPELKKVSNLQFDTLSNVLSQFKS